MTGIQVSIDPGLSRTGMCVWINGKPERLLSFSPKKSLSALERLRALGAWVEQTIKVLVLEGQVKSIVVEELAGFSAKMSKAGVNNKLSMMLCSRAQERILAVCESVYPACIVTTVSKGRITKAQTAALAAEWGLTGNKDQLDAFQIGICAGFDKEED